MKSHEFKKNPMKSYEIPLDPVVFPMNSSRHPSGSPPSKVLKAQAAAPTGPATPGRWRCLATAGVEVMGFHQSGSIMGNQRDAHMLHMHVIICVCMYIYIYICICISAFIYFSFAHIHNIGIYIYINVYV